MIFVGISAFSQETKAILLTHGLGKFHLYINHTLVNRAPYKQVEYISPIPTKLRVKVVFQDHNVSSFSTEITLKKGKALVFVIYSDHGKIKLGLQEKLKVGKYLPGFYPHTPTAMPSYTGRLGCDNPCNAEVIEVAKMQMKSEPTEMAQLTIARELVMNHCITVSDLKMVLAAFVYEKDRIQFAKFSWPYVYDQDNYLQLRSSFENAATIDEIIPFVHANQ
tara:strand:- start:9490 stop:10152 length:663 start_codon:yes stop_codon:yes gene_type:complete